MTILLNVYSDTFFDILHVETCIISELVHARRADTGMTKSEATIESLPRGRKITVDALGQGLRYFREFVKVRHPVLGAGSIGQSNSPEVDLARFHTA